MHSLECKITRPPHFDLVIAAPPQTAIYNFPTAGLSSQVVVRCDQRLIVFVLPISTRETASCGVHVVHQAKHSDVPRSSQLSRTLGRPAQTLKVRRQTAGQLDEQHTHRITDIHDYSTQS